MKKKLKNDDSGFKRSISKFLLVMKLMTLLTLVMTLTVSAGTYSQNTKLDLSLRNVTIEQVLLEIENHSRFVFIYESGTIDKSLKRNISVKDETVDEILTQLLSGTDITYSIDDRQILLYRKEGASSFASQQKLTVSGRVTDSAKAPLPGVSVMIKGTAQGIVTDENGVYSLSKVPSDATLVFSFIGMKTVEMKVEGKTQINVSLQDNNVNLEEVVAVGYGTMKKSDITGSVASFSNEKLENRPSTNALQSIQGNIAGVTISQSSSVPGASPDIYIRGLNSISASNEPLVVIDGVPGTLDFVNPNDIESIDVLKDASSSAIYGSRGANGVILVTTKRGQGKPKVSYSTYYGFKKATRLIDYMSPEKYLYYREKFAEYSGLSPEPEDVLHDEEYLNYSSGKTTDWQDLVFKNAPVSEHNLSVSGSDSSLNYFLSAGYLDHDHIEGNYNLKRKNVRIDIDKKFNDWLKVGNNLQVVEDNTTGSYGNKCDLSFLNPYMSPEDPEGNTYVFPIESYTTYVINPLTYFSDDARFNTGKTYINENIYVNVKLPVPELNYKISYGYIVENDKSNSYYGQETAEGRDYKGTAEKNTSNEVRWLLENVVDYKKTIKNHSFYFTGLYSAEKDTYEALSASAYGFLNDNLTYNNLSAASNYNPPSSDASRWSMTSLMGRLNYNYGEKYLLTLTYRRDGYSVFGSSKKYGNFPSAAIAWRISQENFMQGIDFLSQLKLRLSWGKNGNQSIKPYSSKAKIGTSVPYAFGSSTDVVYGFYPETIANSKLGWETTTSSNIGIDFGFFNNRIAGAVEYYHTSTSDLLLTRGIPYTTGYSSIYDNIGKTQNDGLEFTLNTINISGTNGFKWSSNLNLSYNKNKIVDLYGDKKDDLGNSWFIGKPINVYYDYVFDGIWQETDDIANSCMPSAQPGSVKVKDISGPDGKPDNTIDSYDRKIVGKKNPDFIWGFTNSFQYKGFNLSFFIQGIHGVTGYHTMHYGNLKSTYENMLDVDYWLPEKPGTKYPTGIYNRTSTYNYLAGYCDADYIRLKDLTFGYTLPKDLITKVGLGIDKIYLYLNATNLFTITDWPLYDPETTTSTDPMTKSYILGLNVSF